MKTLTFFKERKIDWLLTIYLSIISGLLVVSLILIPLSIEYTVEHDIYVTKTLNKKFHSKEEIFNYLSKETSDRVCRHPNIYLFSLLENYHPESNPELKFSLGNPIHVWTEIETPINGHKILDLTCPSCDHDSIIGIRCEVTDPSRNIVNCSTHLPPDLINYLVGTSFIVGGVYMILRSKSGKENT